MLFFGLAMVLDALLGSPLTLLRTGNMNGEVPAWWIRYELAVGIAVSALGILQYVNR